MQSTLTKLNYKEKTLLNECQLCSFEHVLERTHTVCGLYDVDHLQK